MGTEDKSALKASANQGIEVVSVRNTNHQQSSCPSSAALEEPLCAAAGRAIVSPTLCHHSGFNPNNSADSSFHYVQLHRYRNISSLQGVPLISLTTTHHHEALQAGFYNHTFKPVWSWTAASSLRAETALQPLPIHRRGHNAFQSLIPYLHAELHSLFR